MVITTRQSLNSDSAQVQSLFMTCQNLQWRESLIMVSNIAIIVKIIWYYQKRNVTNGLWYHEPLQPKFLINVLQAIGLIHLKIHFLINLAGIVSERILFSTSLSMSIIATKMFTVERQESKLFEDISDTEISEHLILKYQLPDII